MSFISSILIDNSFGFFPTNTTFITSDPSGNQIIFTVKIFIGLNNSSINFLVDKSPSIDQIFLSNS